MLTKTDIKELIVNGRAEILPPAPCTAARQSARGPAKLSFAVDDAVVMRMANQVGDKRDIFVVVRILAEDVRAKNAGIILPPGGGR